VLRFETEAGNVFFKAAAHGGTARERGFLFANEAALLEGLAGHFPEHLPRPIATDPERVWMLLSDAGDELAESEDVDAWEEAIRLHARHQRRFIGQGAELARIGCLDRRLSRLRTHLDELLTDDAARALLEPGDDERLQLAAPGIQALIDEAAGLGIPETLVHGDLHAGNVGLCEGRIVFFDWTDACIGHPFLDVVTFLDGEMVPDAVAPERERLRAAYLDEWRGVAEPDALERAAEIVSLLGMLLQAVSYQHMLPVLEEPDRTAMGRGLSGWLAALLDRVTETTPGHNTPSSEHM
jgi:aminoglycoside/choline kinase family phosphotransferase